MDFDFFVEEYPLSETNNLANVVKLLRQQRGWTQKQLAEKIGISQKTFSSQERNIHAANFSRVMELLDILGYEIVIRQKSSSDTSSDLIGNPPLNLQ